MSCVHLQSYHFLCSRKSYMGRDFQCTYAWRCSSRVERSLRMRNVRSSTHSSSSHIIFLDVGDVTQWESVRFACEMSSARLPASPAISCGNQWERVKMSPVSFSGLLLYTLPTNIFGTDRMARIAYIYSRLPRTNSLTFWIPETTPSLFLSI